MKQIIFIALFCIFTILVSPVNAAVATPSATPSTDQVNDNLTTRLQTLVKENLATTEAAIKNKLEQQTLIGQTGNITAVTTKGLTLNSKDSVLFQVTVNDKTKIVNGNADIKLSTLAIGQKIIIIGIPEKSDVITAKRIVTITDTTPNPRQVVYGQIIKVDEKAKTFNMSTVNGKINVSVKANYKVTDLKVGQTLLAIVKNLDDGIYLVKGKILQ